MPVNPTRRQTRWTPPATLNATELAEIVGVSTSTMYRVLDSGKVPCDRTHVDAGSYLIPYAAAARAWPFAMAQWCERQQSRR